MAAKIVLTGGGTGGHLFPLVAVARKIKILALTQNLGEPEIYYLGPEPFLSKSLAGEPYIRSVVLITFKWRRYFSFKNFIDLLKMIFGLLQALWQIWVVMPDVIFSKGGYGSVGTVFAGWLYRIPIIIHESDSIPGAANRSLARFASLIAVSFSEAAQYFPKDKTYFTGEATRDGFFKTASPEDRAAVNLTGSKPLVVVAGGSQGAEKINDIVLGVLPELLNRAEVVHQGGENNYADLKRQTELILKNSPEEIRRGYHLSGFLDETAYTAAFRSAALIVSRSGAGTIFEIAAAGRPSILIPLNAASRGEQKSNAYIFSKNGAAEVIEEGNLTPKLLLSVIGSILSSPEKSKTMGERAKEFASPQAAELIAQALLNLIPR